jgi:plasmid stabilization system protein ParE
MDAALRDLAARQDDLVAAWQLLAEGWTRRKVKHHVVAGAWRVIHHGVYALTQAPLTQRQLWIAATLTAPNSFLSHASAGACWGFRPYDGSYEVVTRPGRGGPRRHGNLLVCRSSVLDGDTTTHQGIPVTTAARTLIDLSPHVGDDATRKAFREAIRLKTTTTALIGQTAQRHRTRPGSSFLAALAARYATLPYRRARSDAECVGLEVLHDADRSPPELNVKVAGEEADFVWRDRKLIIEIDGPQYHLFADEDARKQRVWEGEGFAVRRVPSDDVYEWPGRLVALSRAG